MLFNSTEFLLFLPVVFVLYWFVCNKSFRLQNILVLISSYFFYGWWSWKFMLLLGASTVLDYLYGFGVADRSQKRSKLFLWLSIINNLGILAIFKYYNFFITQFQKGFETIGIETNLTILNLALPVGISFYTFHGMSYVFDIYKGKIKPVKSLVDYAVFVSFFPLLVAGPIERANHLLPQIQRARLFNYEQAVQGCRLILWGFFKKIVIADSLAKIADQTFHGYTHQDSTSLLMGAIAFSFQIYGDFSGYSDIALGTAKLFGFELLSNFKFPYFSRNIAEFWRRWHISLSSWFRDYLYIPLGGSKSGKLKAVRNTFIIFTVSGFWHGASWNFIAWGFIHACAFIPLLLTKRNRIYTQDVVAQNRRYPSLREIWQMFSTFSFITVAWIFFRMDSIGDAIAYIIRIFYGFYIHPGQIFGSIKGLDGFLYIGPLIIIDWWLRKDERILRIPKVNKAVRYLIYCIFAFWIIQTFVQQQIKNKNQSFIYFQF